MFKLTAKDDSDSEVLYTLVSSPLALNGRERVGAGVFICVICCYFGRAWPPWETQMTTTSADG